ncbi:hypothetical protein A2U01_0115832, partial [Trifolium medium]|nr:hypothetical protein [Trifolium medium]
NLKSSEHHVTEISTVDRICNRFKRVPPLPTLTNRKDFQSLRWLEGIWRDGDRNDVGVGTTM